MQQFLEASDALRLPSYPSGCAVFGRFLAGPTPSARPLCLRPSTGF